ncbi:immunoglobulin gamma-1 heavy chain-like [Colius striatus]|uniref:immunoglobulin gamma-1 heavy chain-like n=1 Tax=Colius striatus TaxID=57412 RepID=UPI002B1D9F21|nr:immunoglobulin gamma-1 heavy chain-like [Colius striatus]XP_061876152.1 immunoglobulin gamma-1 heavy chain-like [Colius striatus]
MAAGPGPWLLGLGLALGPAGVWAQLRLVEAGGGQRAPGDSVLLFCRGHGFNFGTYAIRWYRQAPGGRLEWVSFISPSSSLIQRAPAVNGRASVSRDNSRFRTALSLSALSPQDSARYFCAVRTHRDGKWSFQLVFGSGHVIFVEPNNIRSSDPQVIVMKSKKLEEDGNTEKVACLARKFYTKNVILEVSSNEVIYEQNTPVLTSEGLYDTIKVVSATKGTEVACTAKHDGKETLLEKEAEESVTGNICNTTDISMRDAEGEKTNMLSVTVLGLRVLLAKSIAFNALVSIKLFLF